MRGAAALWSTTSSADDDEIVRACALLAGISLVLHDTHGEIKKAAPFSRRLLLPFFAVPPYKNGKKVIYLGANQWSTVRLTDDGVERLVHGKGVEGLGVCLQALIQVH